MDSLYSVEADSIINHPYSVIDDESIVDCPMIGCTMRLLVDRGVSVSANVHWNGLHLAILNALLADPYTIRSGPLVAYEVYRCRISGSSSYVTASYLVRDDHRASYFIIYATSTTSNEEPILRRNVIDMHLRKLAKAQQHETDISHISSTPRQ
jgi:hypothetical protein